MRTGCPPPTSLDRPPCPHCPCRRSHCKQAALQDVLQLCPHKVLKCLSPLCPTPEGVKAYPSNPCILLYTRRGGGSDVILLYTSRFCRFGEAAAASVPPPAACSALRFAAACPSLSPPPVFLASFCSASFSSRPPLPRPPPPARPLLSPPSVFLASCLQRLLARSGPAVRSSQFAVRWKLCTASPAFSGV
jgi:hypothetical protein